MLTALNRHLVQPLAACKAGSRHLRYLKYLERTQFDAPEVIRLRQLTRLKQTLRHAYATVPFYRRAWDDAGIHPTDVRSLDDLRLLPVLSGGVLGRVPSPPTRAGGGLLLGRWLPVGLRCRLRVALRLVVHALLHRLRRLAEVRVLRGGVHAARL